ncbi:MAG: AAA family ATPase [Deltaproteobacteria bacterium]|jgi:hypothetical protein|nr:AAA family ATPase [Deltaproteobacteria bacterium]
MALKGLNHGTKTFAKLIDENLLYAYKAKFICELARGPNAESFLPMPRRFGKTLLPHTVNVLFTDNRKRFEGLWTGQSGYAFPNLPAFF